MELPSYLAWHSSIQMLERIAENKHGVVVGGGVKEGMAVHSRYLLAGGRRDKRSLEGSNGQ